jgi:propanol-preferring alcohol dehydrogenase
MVVVIGAGGLGLMAVQLAKATTNARIAIVDIDENKLVEAKRLGADEIINSATGDPVKGVKEVTDGLGAETVIDFVNNGKTAPNSLNMLRKRGRLVMVGLFGGSLELNLPLVPLRAFTLTGAYTGKFADLVELVALARMNKIQSLVSRKFTLDQANSSLEELKAGKIIGRSVINPKKEVTFLSSCFGEGHPLFSERAITLDIYLKGVIYCPSHGFLVTKLLSIIFLF